MVTEALVHSLRPPDRYPPRLGSLTDDQEQVVRELLEAIALGELVPGLQAEAQQALEEWWLPNPRARPTPADVAARRAMPVTWRPVAGPGYRLLVPDTFTGSGPRDIPQESRHVQTWGGALCYDAPAVVAVNITARDGRALADILHERVATLLCDAGTASPLNVPGASEALRLDGWHAGDSPAARQRVALVLSAAGGDLVLLTVRSWPRDDVDREREVIVHSLVLQR